MANNNVYQMVTDQIIKQLENGVIAWHKPWSTAEGGAISYTSRKHYSFLNQMLLGEAGEYLTFNEIERLGGKINKGAKAKFVVFYKMYKVVSKDEMVENADGELEPKINTIPLLRYYKVFNVKDTDLSSKIKAPETFDTKTAEEIDNVIMDYVMREQIKFQNDRHSDKAFYRRSTDEVVVPMAKQYKDVPEYYSTTFHELVHSTMLESRCNRMKENSLSFFGGEDYSREELVAEIGSAMICTKLGVAIEKSFKNSVAYIQSWIKALKNDPKMIVWASARAEKAADYILNV